MHNFCVKMTRHSQRFLNYIKSLCQKCSNISILYINDGLKALLSKSWMTCENSTIFQDATLYALILRLSLFKCFSFFKFTMPREKSDNDFYKLTKMLS